MCHISITFCSMSLGVAWIYCHSISEWVAQVCIGAQLHWHSIPHPAPHALGSLCPFSLSRKCASTFQKLSLRSNHTPTFRSSKLDTHVKISTNLGKKCGLRYNVSSTWRVRSWDPHRHPHLSLLYTSTNPTDFLSGSSCRKRLSRCPKAFRLCEYAQDVHSCPMALRLCCTPPTPHPTSRPLHSLQRQLRQFNSGQKQGPLI